MSDDLSLLTIDPRLTEPELALVREAAALALDKHGDQVDKAGNPYFRAHLLDVHRRVVGYGGNVHEQVAALLHDVVEDASVTAEELREAGIPAASVRIVELLTKVEGEPIEDYYARIRAHEPARRVKLFADVASNSDPARMALLDDAVRARMESKYAKATLALSAPSRA